MRLSLLLGTALLALSTVATAQTPAGPPPAVKPATTTLPVNPQAQNAAMPAMPPLTAQQQTQVQAIMLEEAQHTRDRLAKVLTPEQMAALDARMKANVAAMKRGSAQP